MSSYWYVYGEDPDTHQDQLIYKFLCDAMDEYWVHNAAKLLEEDGYQNVRILQVEE